MSIPYEKIVRDDLNLGYGDASVTMPAGGTATSSKIGIHTFTEVYNAKDFGAVGDGVANDTAAINAALAISGVKRVYIPRGRYRLTGSLLVPSNTTLDLDPGAVLVRAWASTQGISEALVRNTTWGGDSNITLLGGVFDLASSLAGHVVAFNKCARVRVSGCRVVDFKSQWAFTFFDCTDVVASDLFVTSVDKHASEDAFHVEGGSRIALTNFHFDTGDDCIALIQEAGSGTTEATTDLTDVTISNGYCHSTIANGIRIQSAFGQSAVRAIRRVAISNVIIRGGNFNTDGGGMKISDDTASGKMTDFLISNVHIDASDGTTDCVKLYGLTRVRFSGVTINAPYDVGFLVDGCNNAKFIDCEVVGTRHAGKDALQTCVTAGCSDVQVIGGHYEGATGHAIHLGAASHGQLDARVIGAFIKNCTGDGVALDNCQNGALVQGNRVTGCANGVSVTASCTGCQILGNDLHGNSTSTVSNSGAATVRRGNRISGATDAVAYGSAALSSGLATVTTSEVEGSDHFILTRMSVSGGQGMLRIGAVTPGFPGTFEIRSSDATDGGTIHWELLH